MRHWDLSQDRCVQVMNVGWTVDGSGVFEYEPDFIGALYFYQIALATGTADGVIRLWDCKI